MTTGAAAINMNSIEFVLTAVLLTAAVHFIIYASKHDYVPVIRIEDVFILRYPRVYLWACIVMFMFAFILIYNAVLSGTYVPAQTGAAAVLVCAGIPLFLYAVVWKIRVYPEYIIFINQIGLKQQIYYKDIRRAVLTPASFLLDTTLKTYRFAAHITYLEYFLKRLNKNGVKIERINV